VRVTFDTTATVTATATETDDAKPAGRTLAGVLVPYGRPGNTSVGTVTVRAGAITYPPAERLSRVKLLNGHDRSLPIGILAELDDTDDGISGRFVLPDTPAAVTAHTEAVAGLRDGFSVELDDVTLADGEITAGRLSAVALVAIPAFDDARLAAEATTTETTPPDAPARDNDPEDKTMPNDNDNAGADVATVDASPRVTAAGIRTFPEFAAAVAAANGERNRADLTAALENITRTANKDAEPAQYVGELWSGAAPTRRVVPRFRNAPLTSYDVHGWRWAAPPEVGQWTGDKTAVPSNAVTTEAVKVAATRLAGAHDVDRKYRDFNDVSFFDAYYRAMAESYAVESDLAVLTDLVTGGTTIAGGADAFAAIVKGMLAVAPVGPPSVLFLAPDVAASIAGATASSAPALLSSVFNSVEGLSGAVLSDLAAGHVLVATPNAATVYELPGSPIRVEAVDMVNGGIDAGVFGYYATIVHKPAGIAVVTVG